MKITPKIEEILNHDFPKEKTGQEEYIDLCKSIYCKRPAHAIKLPFHVSLTYGIHWDDSTKCTVFISIAPLKKEWILPIPKKAPIKYMAGGPHQLYVTLHSMTCSFPSRMWIQCEICRTAFKNPVEMYNYILDTISIKVMDLFTNELIFKQLSELVGNIRKIA